jgi:hypothetical protein
VKKCAFRRSGWTLREALLVFFFDDLSVCSMLVAVIGSPPLCLAKQFAALARRRARAAKRRTRRRNTGREAAPIPINQRSAPKALRLSYDALRDAAAVGFK